MTIGGGKLTPLLNQSLIFYLFFNPCDIKLMNLNYWSRN